MNTLKAAFDMASPGFSNIIKKLNPNLIVYDFLQPWAPEIARLHNVPAVNFWSVGAGMVSFFFHAAQNVGEEFPFEAVRLHDYEQWKIDRLFENSAGGITDKDRALQCAGRSSGFILMKTFRELEGKYLDYLSSLVGKKVIPVGPLVQDPGIEDGNDDIIKWLDEKRMFKCLCIVWHRIFSHRERKRRDCLWIGA